ncbi:hypothetical protein C8R43DRAFT_18284 [Mycena crocata]|nr:hypothetical protein C8R43DRAFT_18284 [Mycena crocata]
MGSPHSFIALLPALAFFLLILCAPSANAAVTNKTVDDSSSAFTFTGSWTATSAANPCDFCSSKPDSAQTFGGTWHDGNYRADAPETTGGSFTFTGSAVYIFGIDQATSQPDIVFTLGNTRATHHFTGTERFLYNALFFSATGLAADQTHTVNWIFNINPSSGVGVQAALFDYAIVTSGTEDVVQKAPGTTTEHGTTTTTNAKALTTEQKQSSTQTTTSTPSSSTAANNLAGGESSSLSTSPSNAQSSTSSSLSSDIPAGAIATSGPQSAASSGGHSSNTGAIVGGVLGILVLLVLTLIVFFLCRRRKQRQCARKDDERRAAGLGPAQPGMRRIRGNYVLQPFVDDRPLAGADAFAATATETGAGTGTGVSTDTSAAFYAQMAMVAGGAAAGPSTGTYGTFVAGAAPGTGASATPGAAYGQPPAFVEDAATAGRYPSDAKMPDGSYSNPHSQQPGVSRQMSQSTQSVLSRADTLMSPLDKHREQDADRGDTETLAPSDSLTSARERYLEQRLATLEAHVASYLPPPYEHPEPPPAHS